MKLTFKVLAFGSLVLSAGLLSADCNTCETDNDCSNGHCKTALIPFSQGDNIARDYMMVEDKQHLADKEDWNWHLGLALEYNRSFDSDKLGAYFFPSNNTIHVGKNNVTGVDVRNTDLGLTDSFDGTLTINPKISNFIIEPAFYVGFDRWVEGLWAWTKLPMAYTRWKMEMCERITDSGLNYFLYSTMHYQTQVAAVTQSIVTALSGTTTWGDKKTPLKAGRFLNCSHHKFGVADIPLHIGYDFISKERGYMGLYARVVFPTGSIKNVQSVFNPRIGLDRWQLGGGLDARVRLYEKDEKTCINAFLDVHATHAFGKHECRLFDMKDRGCLSRYMLLQEVDASGNYTGTLVSFADIFTACVDSSFDWLVDGMLKFELKYKSYVFDLGYECKARDAESFDCDALSLCNVCDEDACDDCTNATTSIMGSHQYGIKATATLPATGAAVTTYNLAHINTTPALADTTPTFITSTNYKDYINLDSARAPRAVAHKVFGNFGYTWEDRDYPIFAGLGGEVDFGMHNKVPRTWAVRGKVGVAYN